MELFVIRFHDFTFHELAEFSLEDLDQLYFFTVDELVELLVVGIAFYLDVIDLIL